MNKMFLANDFWEKLRPEDPYLAKVHDFMRAWKTGQQEFVLHTSGSTGAPKPIRLSRNQLVSSAVATGKALNLGSGTRALVCLNVNYIAGLMMLVRGMELDWQLAVIEPSSNPLLDIDASDEFDFAALVPMQLASILENSSTRNRANSLGKILLGGAPVSSHLQNEISQMYPPVFQSYGMTETVSHVALRKLNGPLPEDYYTFLPGIQFGTDPRSCLFVSGAVTNGETVQTNDLVEISGNTFKWIGRADHVINSGGVKIVLDQVDEIVAQTFFHLGIANSFFSWYLPDEKLGQKLVLIVEGQPLSFGEDLILDEIRKRSSAYETPKHIYFVAQFTKTPTGKVDKRSSFQQFSQF
ncbi:AMP-binding protein [Dyadobacter sp. CY343]|uniref:AMP-binding protein n=1 Tax=Dyadobacter sp. CY343 TaxID=2907299 RepID=UPI001F40A0DC|nr:AMP-binding protein [Dyadobacter sp. CY343]MCE7060519.1 AMP-binding protein [Dyadobacter sp. CY343]